MSNNNPSADAGDINSSSHPTLQVEEIAPNQTDSSFTAYLKLFGVFITLLSLYIVYRFFRKTRSQVTSHDEYIRLPQGEGDIELGHQTKKLTVIHGDDDDDDPSSWEEWGAPKPKFSPVSSIHSVQHISPIKSMNSENPKSGLDLRPASKPSSPQILSPSTSDSVLKHYSLPHSDNNNNSSNSYDSLPLSLNASSINQQSSFNSINAESGIQSKQVKTKKTAAINDLNDVDLFAVSIYSSIHSCVNQ
jgi:hypothetical protein